MILFGLLSSCNIPKGVIEAKIGAIEDNLNKLEKIIDNKVDAETIETLKQQLFEINKTVNAPNFGIIKYGGAWAVIVGTSVMAIIFLSAIGLAIKYYLKFRTNNGLLTLVTKAVRGTDPSTQRMVKDQINSETNNGGPFTPEHKKLLSDFTIKNNTFATEQKIEK